MDFAYVIKDLEMRFSLSYVGWLIVITRALKRWKRETEELEKEPGRWKNRIEKEKLFEDFIQLAREI